MDNRFSPLFEPFTLNNAVTIDNRLVVAPMTHYSSHDDGSLSDEERAFLAGRATGFGMFITRRHAGVSRRQGIHRPALCLP